MLHVVDKDCPPIPPMQIPAPLALPVILPEDIRPRRLPLGPVVEPRLLTCADQRGQLPKPKRRYPRQMFRAHVTTPQTENRLPRSIMDHDNRLKKHWSISSCLLASRAITSGQNKMPAPAILPREN